MTASEVDVLLEGILTCDSASYNIRIAFRNEMRNKQYGRSALMQAWHFFLRGWRAALHYRTSAS